jgi:type I restriction enzyme, S subunit
MKQYESQFRKLTDVGSVNRGKSRHRPRDAAELYGGPYPFVQTGDVKAANFFITEYTQTYSERGLAQSKLWPPGTLLITIAANIAETAVLKIPACFPDSIIGFIARPGESDVRFMKYCLDTYKRQMQSISEGTTQDNLSQGKLLSLRFRIPDYCQQVKIAAILSAYDELIENNKLRIALLEKLAAEIYRESFVRFRFPGHATTRIKKRVPSGWTFEKASHFFGIVKGKSYSGDEITEDPHDMPFISLKSFNRGGGYRPDGLKYYSGRCKTEQVARHNDVVMAITDMTQERAVVGRAARIPPLGDRGAVISLDAVKLVPHNINNTFLYAYMRYSGFADYIKEFANGANVLHLIPDLITKQKVILPPRKLQDHFADDVSNCYAQMDSLDASTSKLTATRNLLLPRLISGKLSVEKLDISFPPAMVEEQKAKRAEGTNA